MVDMELEDTFISCSISDISMLSFAESNSSEFFFFLIFHQISLKFCLMMQNNILILCSFLIALFFFNPDICDEIIKQFSILN